jgi:hypothetical protein
MLSYFMNGCPFCDILEPVLMRNQHALAIGDKNPVPIFGIVFPWSCAFWRRIIEPRAVGEEDVESAVVVVIE